MRVDDQQVGLASEAFVFGYPLVSSVRQINRIAEDGVGSIGAAGFNAFAHEIDPPGPMSPFLQVIPCILHSLAQVDLGGGPLVLHIPPTGDRYHVLQLADAWLNVFGYLRLEGPGARADRGGDFLLVPPGWAGTDDLPAGGGVLPTGGTRVAGGPGAEGSVSGSAGEPEVAGPGVVDVVEAPTRVFSILARFAYHGPDDLPAVRALQEGLSLRPLREGPRRAAGPPERSKQVCDDLRFWEEFRTWLRAFPPLGAEGTHARRFTELGLFASPSPYIDPDPQLAWSLRSGLIAGRDELERLAAAGRVACQGWVSTLHGADYNLDRFGPGMLDDPYWQIPDRVQARITRAMAARRPFIIAHAYETASAHCCLDGDGRRLTGAHSYLLRLIPPPVDAFWALILYDEPEGYLVDNPLHRYTIDSRDELARDPDGSVPILIQNDEPTELDWNNPGKSDNPGARRAALNWLPAAAGDFHLVLRMYRPSREVLSGAYCPDPVHRVR